MGAPAQKTPLSHAQYLEIERASDGKHELVRGEMFAMAGGTPDHGAYAVQIAAILSAQLRGRPCRIFSSDVRVRAARDMVAYPDLTIVCGQLVADPEDKDAITNPTLLVEVLSSSTEGWDRGEKAAYYRAIPSLREYLIVSQKVRHLELQRRSAAGGWELLEARESGSIELASIGCRLDVDEVYRNDLPAAGAS